MNLNIISAINENYTNNTKKTTKSLNNLSSGLRINKASDDASGIAIADKLRTHASGIKQSIANANSGIAMLNIADKAIEELSNILDIIKTKSIQMATDTTSEEGRKIIKTEILKLIDNYDSIVKQTNYNNTSLLKGCEDITFHVGNNIEDTLTTKINSLQTCDMGNENPYKLNNFITGFERVPDTTTNIGNSISSDIPGFENFDWSNATIDGNGNYVIDDFNLNISGNQDMNLDNQTRDVFNINSSIISDIEFTFNGFGATGINPEKFSIISNGNLVGEIQGTGYTGNENITTPLNTNVVSNWDYSNLESAGTGTIKLSGINQDISIKATGQALSLSKISITFDSNPSNEPKDDCSCDFNSLIRNDVNPNLKTQAKELMSLIDTALNQLNLERSEIGSTTNQLESTTRNLMTDYVNTKNAESVIRDVDYAQESANFSKLNVLSQGGSFAQAKGNETQQRVLELLKN